MRQGEVILVNFPFSDRSSLKARPALVISGEKMNNGKDLIILAISSQKGNDSFCVKLLNENLKLGELLRPSYIRCSAVLTIEKSLIKKTVAVLTDKKLKEAVDKFVSLLR